jgi:multidrug efflux pump
MMTSMAAILTALPLAIGMGAGAALRRPLGIALIGGLILSQGPMLLPTQAIHLPLACASARRRQCRAQARMRLCLRMLS